MTTPTDNSQKTAKMTTLSDLREEVFKYGKYPTTEALLVAMAGSEILIGSVDVQSSEYVSFAPVGRPTMLRNPKRIVRLSAMGPGGLQIQYVIGDLDLINEGIVWVQPHAAYYLQDLDEDSQINYLKLILDFFRRKAIADSGLVIPDTKTVREVTK
jgi:hypothetical protein